GAARGEGLGGALEAHGPIRGDERRLLVAEGDLDGRDADPAPRVPGREVGRGAVVEERPLGLAEPDLGVAPDAERLRVARRHGEDGVRVRERGLDPAERELADRAALEVVRVVERELVALTPRIDRRLEAAEPAERVGVLPPDGRHLPRRGERALAEAESALRVAVLVRLLRVLGERVGVLLVPLAGQLHDPLPSRVAGAM